MKRGTPEDILESVFVANPSYELVLFDRLPAEQRELLKELRKDPNLYGVLRPLGKSRLSTKAVSRDTALLYLTLQQEGRLPGYVRETLGDRCTREITRLVLDSVLALKRDGKFLSGSAAAGVIGDSNEKLLAGPASEGFLEHLSLEALRYAQALGLTDSLALSCRLYGYNSAPLSPYWKRTLPDAGAVVEYLRVGKGRNRELLDREWLRIPDSAPGDGWLAWQSRRLGTRVPFGDRTTTRCKLYISPQADQLPEVFPLILEVLSRTQPCHFKVGKDAAGLLRPDKIVAYFSNQVDLTDTAEQLKRELDGCNAQGVPFTAGLADCGLLSWGVDPPLDEPALPWIGRESWRLWVTNRLAVALISASSDETASLEPWQFALRRLQLEGVDIHSWIPADTDWQRCCGARN